MSSMRKDQVYVLSNFFGMTLIGFTAFMSTDFIRLLAFDTVKDESYWISAYQIMLWSVTVGAMLVKIPAAPSLMYCLRYNAFFLIVTAVAFFMNWFESISFHLLVILWAYSVGIALVNAVVFASYHHSGARGLALGCMLSFASTYVVLEIMKYKLWILGTPGSYRNIVVGYLALRLVANFAAMAILSSGAHELHFEQFDNAFKDLKKGVLLEWLSGTLHDTNVRIALSEVVPRYVSPIVGISKISESGKLTAVWLMFLALSLSCSIFTPYLGVSNWDLSVFKIGEIDRAEHVGNFIGAILGTIWRQSWCGVAGMVIIYTFHVALSVFLSCYVHSYKISLVIPVEPVIALTCITAALGSFLTVVTFTHFFDLALELTCCNAKEEPDASALCCRDDDSLECLCSEQFCNERCGKSLNESGTTTDKKIKVHIPPNNEEMYKLWRPDLCLLCWLYRHNPDEVCHAAEEDQKQNEDNTCHYILRNCKVSICPYCDMNLLMECSKIECICDEDCLAPLPNANMFKEDDEYQAALRKYQAKKGEGSSNQSDSESSDGTTAASNNEEDLTDEKPIKIPLHEMKFPNTSNISIVTTASTDFVIADSACCNSRNAAQASTGAKSKPRGRDFNVLSICCYSCCHYDLKVMVRCQEPNSTFHLMQQPYPGKFNPIGCIVFNGTCSKTTNHNQAQGTTQQQTTPANKKDPILVPRDIKNSLTYACQESEVSSITRVPCTEDTVEENGLCACCKTANTAFQKITTNCATPAGTTTTSSSTSSSSSTASGGTTQSNHPTCCHMKVKPTAMPYHFRKMDIFRNSFVGALFFIIFVFATAKLLIAILFAVVDLKTGLDLSSNFTIVEPFFKQSEDPNTYGIYDTMNNEQLQEIFETERSEALSTKLTAMGPVQQWLASPSFDEVYESNVKRFSGEPEGKHSTQSTASGHVESEGDATTTTEDTHNDFSKDIILSSGIAASAESNGEEPSGAAPESKNEQDDDKAADSEDEDTTDKAKSEASDDDDEEKEEEVDEASLSLVDYEKHQMEKVLKQYKWLCNDLEYAYLENWAEETAETKKKDEDVEKIKRIRRVKWCLDSGLKEYALQSADAIKQYLTATNGKWDAEWHRYESGIKHKLKILGNTSSLLSPVNASKLGNAEWQIALTDAKIAMWREVSKDAEKLADVTKKLEELGQAVTAATGTEVIVAMIALWRYRIEVIEHMTTEGVLFLNWRSFKSYWEQILSWETEFLPLYLEEYKDVKSL
ncbi:carbohydrate ABC transporter membrane protein 1 [Babesia caballi]|uniref:Carbohydrate ABC transporter membrane protein 1 n=1 Tax=Babesia caballi TaxID=5871 RepID=A0AAV4LRW2_BABCB|nr:carbohydrate ABC transporter membrane protein 1 [Babesia caballi]